MGVTALCFSFFLSIALLTRLSISYSLVSRRSQLSNGDKGMPRISQRYVITMY